MLFFWNSEKNLEFSKQLRPHAPDPGDTPRVLLLKSEKHLKKHTQKKNQTPCPRSWRHPPWGLEFCFLFLENSRFFCFFPPQKKTSDPMPQILETPPVGPGVFFVWKTRVCLFFFQKQKQKQNKKNSDPMPQILETPPVGPGVFFVVVFFENSRLCFLFRPHAPDPGDTPRGAWSFVFCFWKTRGVFWLFQKKQNKTSDPMPQILETPPGAWSFFWTTRGFLGFFD